MIALLEQSTIVLPEQLTIVLPEQSASAPAKLSVRTHPFCCFSHKTLQMHGTPAAQLREIEH